LRNGFNLILLHGTVSKPPIRFDTRAVFYLDTTRLWRDRTTQLTKSETTTHTIIAYKELAEVVMKKIDAGSEVLVEGFHQIYQPTNSAQVCQIKANIIHIMNDLDEP
jgi:single-stranded DNA-binding protein